MLPFATAPTTVLSIALVGRGPVTKNTDGYPLAQRNSSVNNL